MSNHPNLIKYERFPFPGREKESLILKSIFVVKVLGVLNVLCRLKAAEGELHESLEFINDRKPRHRF